MAKSRTRLSDFTFTHWRRKWQPTPGFLPGESQGRRSLVGCRLWGRTESDTPEATQQQQQQTGFCSLSHTDHLTNPFSPGPPLPEKAHPAGWTPLSPNIQFTKAVSAPSSLHLHFSSFSGHRPEDRSSLLTYPSAAPLPCKPPFPSVPSPCPLPLHVSNEDTADNLLCGAHCGSRARLLEHMKHG